MITKMCSKCKQVKPTSEFYKRPNRGKNSVRSTCKDCSKSHLDSLKKTPHSQLPPERKKARRRTFRKSWLKRRYKMTIEDYEEMFEKQGGTCAICKSADSGGKHDSETFMIDHCHKSEKVRGLLCNRCNLAIGVLKDDVWLIERILEYIKIHTTTAP